MVAHPKDPDVEEPIGGVTIGDEEEGIRDSIIAGRDLIILPGHHARKTADRDNRMR